MRRILTGVLGVALFLSGCAAPPAALLYATGVPFADLPGSAYTVEGGGPTTFGVLVCAAAGTVLRISAVGPDASAGSDVAVRGTRVVRFPAGGEITLASPGYPPVQRPGEAVYEVSEAPPVDTCGGAWLMEIQVGLARTGPAGGGWSSVRIDYTGDQSGRVVARVGMLYCGSSTTPCRSGPGPT